MTMRHLTLLTPAVLCTAVLSALSAQDPRPDEAARSAPPPEAGNVYTIDPTHSMALFRVQHLGAGAFWGRFNTVAGTIRHDETAGEPLRLDVIVEIESVDVGNEKLDAHLKSEDFFYAAEHPQATFKSTSSTKIGDRMYEVSGDLTMRGVTRRITVPVEWVGTAQSRNGRRCGFETVFTVNRHDYGIDYGQGALGSETRLTIAMEGVEGDRPARRADRRGGSGGLPGRMARMDANGDGKLQKEELPPPLQDRFDQLDADGDGAVDAAELRAMRRNDDDG